MHVDEYRASLATAMELDAACFESPGITVVPGEDRRGERLASHYRIGEHSVLWVDPDVVDHVACWDGSVAGASFDEFRTWALDQGAQRLGAGYEHVLEHGFEPPPRPDAVRVLDGRDVSVVELVIGMQAACPADDRDQADFDVEALDSYLAGWVEHDQLQALAGGRPFAPRPGYLDVGVLVRPDARRGGRGRSVIAAVVEEVIAAGHTPLYRCATDNERSWRLCRSVGFVPVLQLEAFRWLAAN